MTPVPFRTGIAYDVHRFNPDRPLVLGGVTIPDAPGLEGHSDADCLTHAISDAILGALAQPDIGFHFPPGDPSCLNIDSQKILKFAADLASENEYKIGNVDVMIIAEKPKISPWTEAMRIRIAETLSVNPDQIGIKATTNEKLGSIGRGEGISAMASVLLYRK
tara:strand:+ start:7892 stop:8380 length:489 start_codon:yes stop_codon:yes gene_type:complete